MRQLCLVVLVVAGCVCGCDRGSEQKAETKQRSAGAQRQYRIAVVPKGTTHDFWQAIHAGAAQAANELGNVEIIWRGPEKEDDRDQQIVLLQNYLGSDVHAIVLAPLDENALVPSIQQLNRAGKAVVIIDSGVNAVAGEDYVSFVATDNVAGGRLAAERMIDVLGGEGRVLMLRHAEGSASTMKRELGFTEVINAHDGVTLVDPKRYSGATRDSAQQASENLLATYDDIDGVFCSNESATFGMLLALRARDLTDKLKFVGFDASPGLVAALEAGELDGLVVQNPVRMGYLGVTSAVRHLRGEDVEERIDTGVVMVTPENMDRYRELLEPDLSALGR